MNQAGVKQRVRKWEMQAGANSCGSGVGFFLSAQSRERGLQVGLLLWPHPTPCTKAPRPADHNDGHMEVRVRRDGSGQRPLVASPPQPVADTAHAGAGGPCLPELWCWASRSAEASGPVDVRGLCPICTESLRFINYTWTSHFLGAWGARSFPTCATLTIDLS